MLAQGALPADGAVTRTLASRFENRFGLYALVARPGRIAAGDAATLL